MSDEALVGNLHSTTNAAVWAREWSKAAQKIVDKKADSFIEAITSVIDEGWMIGWFANAIEVGKASEARKTSSTSPYLPEETAARCWAWDQASKFLDPIFEQHGLEKVLTQTIPHTTLEITTPVDQHIEHVLTVANWLLGEAD